MKFKKDYIWPIIGVAAVVFSVWLLLEQLNDISYDDLVISFYAVPLHNWIMALVCTCFSFIALAGYDQLALRHLRRRVSFLFVSARIRNYYLKMYLRKLYLQPNKISV